MTMTLSCSYCNIKYKNSDEIYGTNCGHIFHYRCIQQWKSRSTNCPECQTLNTEMQRIYLNLEETEESQELIELEIQLENSEENVRDLQDALKKSTKELSEVQKKCIEAEKNNETLINRTQELICENENMKTKIAEQEEQIRELLVETVNNPNSYLELEIKLGEKIKVLEQKLEQLSLELSKEIKNSTALSVSKIRLESLIAHQNLETSDVNKSIPAKNISKKLSNTKSGNVNKKMNQKKPIAPKNNDLIKKSDSLCSLSSNIGETSDLYERGVVIRNVSKEKLASSYASYVVQLSNIIGLRLSEVDVEKSFILEKSRFRQRNTSRDSITLVAIFTSIEIKISFLNNKEKLRKNPETSHLAVHEYNSNKTNSLYHHAKILRKVGYGSVYCRDDGVFAREHSHSQLIKIYTEQQVDDLVKLSLQKK